MRDEVKREVGDGCFERLSVTDTFHFTMPFQLLPIIDKSHQIRQSVEKNIEPLKLTLMNINTDNTH